MTRETRRPIVQVLPAIAGLALFLAALAVLRAELRGVSWHELIADIFSTPPRRLALALAFTLANYAVLTGYDSLALAYVRARLSWWRVALASCLAYAIANTVGFSMLSGASVRYRFYTRWGISTEDLTRIVLSNSVTFWLGLLTLGGLSLLVSPLPASHGLPGHGWAAAAGAVMVLTSAGYIGATAARRTPLRIRGFDLALPSTRFALTQLLISMLDWILAAAVAYVLLPPSALTFTAFLGAFLVALAIGVGSHVPGGMGVFEGLMVVLLRPYLTSGQLLPALVAYRAIYYLLPLTAALVLLVADEVRQRRGQVARLGATLGALTEQLMPRVLAIFTFLAGLVLLFSGATPAAPGRLSALARVIPLGVIEVSHFTGSVVGAALLVLSHGLARRLDAAYFLAAAAIVIGIGASLLKGADYEEATLLALLLLVLWRARPAFDRRAAFFETRFSAGWIMAVVGAVSASVWLGLFAFKHVNYSYELWWQFESRGEVSRFLRASVGAATALLLFAMARLLEPAAHEVVEPDAADLEDARAIIAAHSSPTANLVYLRDKAVLFDADRKGFLMYGVRGRTWVALGDPVGPTARMAGLIRLFLERCDDFAGVPVFYEVSKDNLHQYADFGLAFVKLGEEARVDLAAFTLDGGRGARFRQVIRRLEKDGGTFRIIPAADVPGVVGPLREVSDD